ncbi:leukocyte-associated immunoglobulin-like receptor 1 isoform X1 [Lynx rufus]|uniref:leukocyte-associated immunoglobulin-like receptor 1 isoform X1 n=1 Tax=Lynx rufus TaxID=61384 RepID=UPI001F1270D3|nr:leukocyte-associated immunoglobulin-like receptor 1 isoform X1 [Lynx rufus]XP_046956894.1 leukocyte-associated immunoglobulin-like receptor 1 isoform X1 [Lynx rufus]
MISAPPRKPGAGISLTKACLPALCLGWVHLTQEGTLRRPSISAEPAPVVALGQRVTIVCRSPGGFDAFRLEKEGNALKPDVMEAPPGETEARFDIIAHEGIEGKYHCVYHKDGTWSDRSAELVLGVTETPGNVSSPPPQTYISPGDTQMRGDDSDSPDLSTEHVYIFVGVSVALFLCLLLLVLAFLHRQRRKKHRLPSSQGEEQRPQERVSPAVDLLQRTPDVATVGRLPEKDREAPSSAPPAGSPQDVTYAQLDHQILAQRTARGTFPRSTEPTAESSTYASLARP